MANLGYKFTADYYADNAFQWVNTNLWASLAGDWWTAFVSKGLFTGTPTVKLTVNNTGLIPVIRITVKTDAALTETMFNALTTFNGSAFGNTAPLVSFDTGSSISSDGVAGLETWGTEAVIPGP